jgi:hypothetical protein
LGKPGPILPQNVFAVELQCGLCRAPNKINMGWLLVVVQVFSSPECLCPTFAGQQLLLLSLGGVAPHHMRTLSSNRVSCTMCRQRRAALSHNCLHGHWASQGAEGLVRGLITMHNVGSAGPVCSVQLCDVLYCAIALLCDFSMRAGMHCSCDRVLLSCFCFHVCNNELLLLIRMLGHAHSYSPPPSWEVGRQFVQLCRHSVWIDNICPAT